jgi:hypothetical protein
MSVATLGHMTMDLPVLQCGKCEPLKLSVDAGMLGIAALCLAYNAAAWLGRRQTHLAVNAVLYSSLIIWEQRHVAHHLAAIRKPLTEAPAQPTAGGKVEEVAAVATVAAAVLAA